jgi:hypothetical protein
VYLPELRGISTYTLRSYRDALVLFLRFAADATDRPIEQLTIADLDAERVIRFLKYLENVRPNGVAIRNATVEHKCKYSLQTSDGRVLHSAVPTTA